MSDDRMIYSKEELFKLKNTAPELKFKKFLPNQIFIECGVKCSLNPRNIVPEVSPDHLLNASSVIKGKDKNHDENTFYHAPNKPNASHASSRNIKGIYAKTNNIHNAGEEVSRSYESSFDHTKIHGSKNQHRFFGQHRDDGIHDKAYPDKPFCYVKPFSYSFLNSHCEGFEEMGFYFCRIQAHTASFGPFLRWQLIFGYLNGLCSPNLLVFRKNLCERSYPFSKGFSEDIKLQSLSSLVNSLCSYPLDVKLPLSHFDQIISKDVSQEVGRFVGLKLNYYVNFLQNEIDQVCKVMHFFNLPFESKEQSFDLNSLKGLDSDDQDSGSSRQDALLQDPKNATIKQYFKKNIITSNKGKSNKALSSCGGDESTNSETYNPSQTTTHKEIAGEENNFNKNQEAETNKRESGKSPLKDELYQQIKKNASKKLESLLNLSFEKNDGEFIDLNFDENHIRK